MIPPLQPKAKYLYLICACAGPLLPYELPVDLSPQLDSLLDEGLIVLKHRAYALSQQPRLSSLQAQVCPKLRAYLGDLEQLRQSSPSFMLEGLRGRARQALVLKQSKLFLSFFTAYGGGDQEGWHPDRQRRAFWSELLGADLLDAHLLPPSYARNDLIYHVLKRYCLSAFPADMPKPTPPLQESDLISLAYQYYLEQDGSQLEQLHAAYPQLTLVKALLVLSQGCYEESFALFDQCVGTSMYSGFLLESRHEDYLLPLAIQNAVAVGASPSIINRWRGYAERSLLAPLREHASLYHEAKGALSRLVQAEGEEALCGEIAPPQEEPMEQEAIFWDVLLDAKKERIFKIEARLLSPEEEDQRPGRALSLQKLKQGDYSDVCDLADATLLPFVQSDAYTKPPTWHLGLSGLAALSKHPRLRLAKGDGQYQPLRLIVNANTGAPAYKLQEQQDGSFAIHLPEVKTADLAPLSIALSYRAQVLSVQFFAKNQDDIKSVQARYPILLEGQDKGNDTWSYAPLAQALQVLQCLQASDIPLLWQGSKPLRLYAAGQSRLCLNSEGGMKTWFTLGADLRVDEQLICSGQDLMERWGQRQGDFLPLGDQLYLPLSKDLVAQLDFLHAALTPHAFSYKIHKSNLLQLSQLWEGREDQLQGNLAKLTEALQAELAQEILPPASLKAVLRPYQLEGFQWLASRVQCGLGACLADEMGLGKTLQVLALLQHRAAYGASLVVVPLSLIGNWVQESARFCPELKVHTLSSSAKVALPLDAGCLILASYGQLLSRPDLQAFEWNLLVLDEAQAIKNPNSQRSRLLRQFKAQSRVALSATPIENNLLELWSLMNFLNPHMLGKRSQYKGHALSPEAREKMRVLIAPVLLRRRKQEVLQELPALTEVVCGVELSEEERALYESHRRHALEILESGSTQKINILSKLTLLRRLCCHAGLVAKGFTHSSKLDALLALASNLRAEGHRTLIFSQFTDVLRLALARLQGELGAKCLYLDGRCSAKKRTELVQAFQEEQGDSAADFFLISLKAGGSGLNLTGADYVVLLDPWWNPAVEDQAMGRAYRMGQVKPVTMCRMICHNSVEERVLDLHHDKRDLASALEQLPQVDLARVLGEL